MNDDLKLSLGGVLRVKLKEVDSRMGGQDRLEAEYLIVGSTGEADYHISLGADQPFEAYTPSLEKENFQAISVNSSFMSIEVC